jgi:solute carrier family 34 (sodium-dependent phosphate cotransporter)
MGEAFTLLGKDFAESLIIFTANPLVGLFIGILATSLVQSSSATTSIIVGLTAAGSLTVGNAVPMIMGANIGTSITNTLVSLGHIKNKEEFKRAFEVATVHDFFNFIVVLFLFPLELLFHPLEKSATFITQFLLGSQAVTFSNPLNVIITPSSQGLIAFLQNPLFILAVALPLLFLSLHYFVKLVKPLAESNFKHSLDKHVFSKPFRTFLFGIGLTVLVQSSSVSTSLIVPLAGVGMFGLHRIFPYILGANIGTTITALLASLAVGTTTGITVALAHFFFNTFGSVIVYPLKKFPLYLSQNLSHLVLRSRMYPLAYIATVFYLIPLSTIFLLQ